MNPIAPHPPAGITRRASALPIAALMIAALLAVAGCGGGGGGSSSTQPVATNRAPDAAFTPSTSDGLAPLAVTFDASASRDPDGSIAGYAWDFGDDATATAGPTVSHTFADTGTFTVRLTVTDDDGATATTTRNVRVRGASVSGVVRIAPESGVDSDSNDRFAAVTANNDFGTAQAVHNPLRLGGFVNVPDSGSETGNFRQTGDPDDYYFVELLGGERIVLSIGDPDANLDLQLYRDGAPPELVDASTSTDPSEDLTAPLVPGGYFVRVFALSGASNYVLSIGDETLPTATPRQAKRLSDGFVPGDVLTAGPTGAVARQRIARRAGARHYRLAYRDGRRAAMAELTVPEVPLAPGAVADAALLDRYRTLLAVTRLRSLGTVTLAEPNLLRQPLRQPDDAFYDFQWHYRNIELEQAWDVTTGQATGHPEVVVAVVDTGVLLDHPDLRNQWLRDGGGQVIGYDFIQDAARANDGDGIDPNPDDPGDQAGGPGASSFHGTHVAGTIAAESDNAIGVAGVSWGARLMPLRALGIGGGTTFDVMQAVRYAARLSNASGTVPPVRADIINLSLGSDLYSESEQRTFNEARAQGVLVVASAGNANSDVPSYPASYDGVVSVAATTIDRTRAPYSNFGPLIDVAAPGGDGVDRDRDGFPEAVASTIGSDDGGSIEFGIGLLAGTSMAAPHVAGVMALMKSLYPALAPAEFDALLADGQLTDDAGVPGRDDVFGHGIINALQAVQAAAALQAGSGGSIGAVLSVSAGTLNFQAFTQALDFSVSNLGTEDVTVTVAGDQPWLTVSPLATGVDGLGTYRAVVDRTGLADGDYSALITIDPGDDSVTPRTIAVVMRVTSADPDADAGQHYVVLVPVDAEESVAIAVDVVNVSGGEYRFDIVDVPPGDYRLFAGTDLDDDDFICDGGEACGAFPSLSDPAIISVDARQQPTVTDLTFASEFRTTATTTASASGRPGGAGDSADSGGEHGIRLPPARR
jgi:serine protease